MEVAPVIVIIIRVDTGRRRKTRSNRKKYFLMLNIQTLRRQNLELKIPLLKSVLSGLLGGRVGFGDGSGGIEKESDDF